MQRVRLLKELVRDSQYVIDEQLVAAAIIAHVFTRMAGGTAGADTSFRDELLWG